MVYASGRHIVRSKQPIWQSTGGHLESLRLARVRRAGACAGNSQGGTGEAGTRQDRTTPANARSEPHGPREKELGNAQHARFRAFARGPHSVSLRRAGCGEQASKSDGQHGVDGKPRNEADEHSKDLLTKFLERIFC